MLRLPEGDAGVLKRVGVLTVYKILLIYIWGPLMVAQWLRYCATNRKVPSSIPDGVTGIFH
jgi:hypothetical protein